MIDSDGLTAEGIRETALSAFEDLLFRLPTDDAVKAVLVIRDLDGITDAEAMRCIASLHR